MVLHGLVELLPVVAGSFFERLDVAECGFPAFGEILDSSRLSDLVKLNVRDANVADGVGSAPCRTPRAQKPGAAFALLVCA